MRQRDHDKELTDADNARGGPRHATQRICNIKGANREWMGQKQYRYQLPDENPGPEWANRDRTTPDMLIVLHLE